jgi:hypothetical protein
VKHSIFRKVFTSSSKELYLNSNFTEIFKFKLNLKNNTRQCNLVQSVGPLVLILYIH